MNMSFTGEFMSIASDSASRVLERLRVSVIVGELRGESTLTRRSGDRDVEYESEWRRGRGAMEDAAPVASLREPLRGCLRDMARRLLDLVAIAPSPTALLLLLLLLLLLSDEASKLLG